MKMNTTLDLNSQIETLCQTMVPFSPRFSRLSIQFADESHQFFRTFFSQPSGTLLNLESLQLIHLTRTAMSITVFDASPRLRHVRLVVYPGVISDTTHFHLPWAQLTTLIVERAAVTLADFIVAFLQSPQLYTARFDLVDVQDGDSSILDQFVSSKPVVFASLVDLTLEFCGRASPDQVPTLFKRIRLPVVETLKLAWHPANYRSGTAIHQRRTGYDHPPAAQSLDCRDWEG
ncbi:hypothetical protein DXG03_004100 [Asterophora parasitica]|uniref:Uncharacterized protein n=1 Tax=Asterophora parasitica TaxID=117018 RepID=A0A9P7G6X9_9AGAR|nr:hypothetical protein DXG03_004100 [Asterophora parasitica]